MTPEQELALFRKIGSFIENEFYQEFGKEVYGEIIRVCGRHAFQPNNEIRNLLAHLSGAFYTIRTGKTQAVNLLCEIDEHCPSKGAFFSRYPKVRAIGSFWKHHPLSTRIFGGVVATLIVFFATRYLFPDFFDALGTKMASWLNYLRSKL